MYLQLESYDSNSYQFEKQNKVENRIPLMAHAFHEYVTGENIFPESFGGLGLVEFEVHNLPKYLPGTY